MNDEQTFEGSQLQTEVRNKETTTTQFTNTTEVAMSDKKQSSIDFILNAFNLLSDSDFKAWMLNNHDNIKAMHKEEHGQTWDKSMENFEARGRNEMRAWVDFDAYYNETFGGQDNE